MNNFDWSKYKGKMKQKKKISDEFEINFDNYSISHAIEFTNGVEKPGCPGCEPKDDFRDYCRCSKIVNAEVTSVDFNSVFDYISKELDAYCDVHSKDKTFIDYCLHRILAIEKIYDPSLWEVNIVGGYYGQETDGGAFANKEKILNHCQELIKLSPSDRIRYVLNLEYGYLLPELEKCDFAIEKISTGYITNVNNGYHKIKIGTYNSKSYSLPIGIYLKNNERYRLIDGWHRYTDLVLIEKLDIVEIIAAKEN
jgi:hypothetical protein